MTVLRFVALSITLSLGLIACPAVEDAADDGAAGSGGSTAADQGATACVPGATNPCACVGGAMGTQVCATSGQTYGACECNSPTPGTTTGASNPGTQEESGNADSEPDEESSDTDATSGSDGDSSTGTQGCEPGQVVSCGCNRGPGASVCNRAGTAFSECVCCEGSHPLVEGDLRFCEEEHCYCGDLEADPPVDACYGMPIADACCPVAVECY